MKSKEEGSISELKFLIHNEKNIFNEIENSMKIQESSKDKNEKDSVAIQLNKFENKLKEENKKVLNLIGEINLLKPLNYSIKKENAEIENNKKNILISDKNAVKKNNHSMGKDERKYIHSMNSSELEKGTIKRLKSEKGFKENKVQEETSMLQNPYSILSNRVFSKISKPFADKDILKNLERELIKAHLLYTPQGYFSMILFTTFLVLIGSIVISVFFLFFYLGADLPIIHFATNSPLERIPQVIWIVFLFPIATFLIMYFYPSLEKRSAESAINQELPFATIHMAAISGSMIDPTKIFSIIISTKEYPHIEKEFTKLMNELNVYGYDLVSALRNVSFNSPSKKLADLFNGLATTINSGGNLPDFFNKRAESLLFEYNLEKEKSNKSAETFMDIYISVVIAAPMILMLLLMMMKISGLGLSMSTSMITLIMVISVAMVNAVFIVFLHLKK